MFKNRLWYLNTIILRLELNLNLSDSAWGSYIGPVCICCALADAVYIHCSLATHTIYCILQLTWLCSSTPGNMICWPVNLSYVGYRQRFPSASCSVHCRLSRSGRCQTKLPTGRRSQGRVPGHRPCRTCDHMLLWYWSKRWERNWGSEERWEVR